MRLNDPDVPIQLQRLHGRLLSRPLDQVLGSIQLRY